MSVRFDGEYPASTSKDLTIIPSHEDWNEFSRKQLIFANVASLVKQASSASTYKQTDFTNQQLRKDPLCEKIKLKRQLQEK